MSKRHYCDRCNVEITWPINRVKIEHIHFHNEENWKENHKGRNNKDLEFCKGCSRAFIKLVDDFKEATDAKPT